MTGTTGAASARAGAESAAAPQLVVRLAREEEYGAVDALIAEAYAHDYGPTDESGDPIRRAAARSRDYEVWVAVDEAGELLGSVTLRRRGGPPLHEDVAPDELDLRLLGVAPRARRRGVAAALMARAAERAVESGFAAVVLKTAPDMRGAHRLYEALGYARAPERDGLWAGGRRLFDLYAYVRAAPATA